MITGLHEPAAAPTLDPLEPVPLIRDGQSLGTLTDSLLKPVFEKNGRPWWLLFSLATAGTIWLFIAIVVTLNKGIESWGNNIPIAWAFAITNFVWWIGFGHAGTLISAILVLFQQKWRASIHRFAEAMTLAAIVQAGLFPLLHLGRPWFAYWLTAYPTTLGVWPQFKSSLTWDVMAVLTYLFVSGMFWYTGLIPDLAAARDAAPTERKRRAYAVFALGWTGSARQWHQWKIAYLLLAGIATALVLSVESIVSFDFAIASLPGWHELIFPPYFVASAMFAGFALLLFMIIPARVALGFEHVVTDKHVDLLAKMLLLFSLFTSFGFLQENFFGWYSGNRYEIDVLAFKRSGSWSALWWLQIVTMSMLPQVLWVPALRRTKLLVWFIALGIVVGSWMEQFLHVVPPLAHGYLPSMYATYLPTWVDWSILFGTCAFFAWLMLLFGRFVPPTPLSEIKEVHVELQEHTIAKIEEHEAGVA